MVGFTHFTGLSPVHINNKVHRLYRDGKPEKYPYLLGLLGALNIPVRELTH